MSSTELWLTSITSSYELRTLDAMNNSIQSLDSVNNSELWMTLMTPDYDIKALDTMNNVGL